MALRLPDIQFGETENKYAARGGDIEGMVLGYVDGWGERQDDGSYKMYPLMQELHARLSKKYALKDHVWVKKPNISEPLDGEELEALIGRVDLVVNGEGI